MASYAAHSITEARVADDRTHVQIAFAAGPEPVTLVMEWRVASELIDRLAVINQEIRHALSAPDRRAERIRTGCHRAGIVLAVLLALPVAWGLWRWTQGMLDADGWRPLLAFFLAAPAAYGAMWLTGWTIAGFLGNREGPA
jgi:hypothetical protein